MKRLGWLGCPFSTLDPQPSAQEFYDEFSYAIGFSTGEFFFIYRPRVSKFSSIRAQLSSSDREEFECELGGKITQNSKLSVSGSTLNVSVDTDFNDCVILMNFNGFEFEETLSGSSRLTLSGEEGGNATAHMSRAISAAGDLGFALNCDATASGPADAEEPSSYSGSCTFSDSEDTELTISAEEVDSF
jgi:hypothetical protein